MNKEEKRAARCVCFKTLYANSSTGILFDEILDNFNDEEVLEDINKDQIKYASMLFDLTISNKIELDKLIESKLVNWKIERLALMDKIILRMSLSEMLYVESVPPKVSIAEGVEIAKEFSTSDSSSFVNGILDAIYNEKIVN
jgi:N utilization substance protein B